MSFNPYLSFDGTCAEAMQFYADIFGADEVQILRYSDAPESENLPSSDRVMYSHIMVGEACLMASDTMPGMPATPMAAVSVNHPVPDVETGKKIFEALSEGGEVKMPYGEVFFSAAFGMVKDRYGTSWMVGVAPS